MAKQNSLSAARNMRDKKLKARKSKRRDGAGGSYGPFSAISQGKEVTGTTVAVMNIKLEKGLRKVETGNFVFALDS